MRARTHLDGARRDQPGRGNHVFQLDNPGETAPLQGYWVVGIDPAEEFR